MKAKRGSRVVFCPNCGACHLASAVARILGGWALSCRNCGEVPWRAR